MSIVNKDNLVERVRNMFGEGLSDDNLSLIEDMTDTLTDLENKTNTDWEQKYNNLDAEWRRRYLDRFAGIKDDEFEEKIGINKPDDKKPEPTVNEDITIDELFKESE